eukprot:GFUD01125204.1.p1 GENE.GFUD01125204.1~~GFUD01125204.1.p1  ORF type:complete len:136 (-),score=39.36 GFUD01125204.1:50-457(-)
MILSDRQQVLRPPTRSHFALSHENFGQTSQYLPAGSQFLPPVQFPPPRHCLPPTNQPPPSSLFTTSQYRARNTFTMLGGIPATPQTRPPSILLSRPDSPKPVLAVPPVHRATSFTNLATAAGAGPFGAGGDLSRY